MRFHPPRPGPKPPVPPPNPVPPPAPTPPPPVPPPVPPPTPIPGNVIEVTPATFAKSLSAPPGSTVLLRAGIYNASLVPNSGVAYQGAPKEVVWFEGQGGRSGIKAFGVQDVILRGIGFRNWINLGAFQDCLRVKMQNCTLQDGVTTGPWLANSHGCEVSGCTIARCGTGTGDNALAAENCNRLLIEGNDVSGGAHAGIQAFACSSLLVRRNIVHENHGSGLIIKRGCNNALIEGNRVTHSARSSESAEHRKDAGIQFVGSDSTIRNNLVMLCGGGIILSLDADPNQTTARNVVELNTCLNNEDVGLDFSGFGAAGQGRMTGNVASRNIVSGNRVELRLQLAGAGFGGNRFMENVCWPGPVQALDGVNPPVDSADPRFDANGKSAAFPGRGYQG